MAPTVLMESSQKPKNNLFLILLVTIWSRLASWSWRFHNKSIKNLIRPQGDVTPKWLIRSGRNSNSSEILCLSWLPASLTKIQSRMNELAWRHHFPIIIIWEIFRRSRAPNSAKSGPIRPKFELAQSLMHVPASLKKIWWKTTERIWWHRLPHYIFVNDFWSNLPLKSYQPFLHLSDASYKIWSRLTDWPQRYSSLNVWTTTMDDEDGRTADCCYTIIVVFM